MRGVDLRDRQAHLAEQIAEQMGRAKKRAKPWKSLIAATLALVAAGVSATGNDHLHQKHNSAMWHAVWLAGSVGFLVFGASATLGLSKRVREMLQFRFGSSHATMARVVLVFIGWAIILTVFLNLLNFSIERLLLGGALTGVLLGIAAQQTLANIFAGVVLLLAKPFQVGDEIKLFSGAMGGPHEGQVIEIGLTYIRLETDHGITHLPNSQVLSSAIGPRPAQEADRETDREEVESVDSGPDGHQLDGALGGVAGVEEESTGGGAKKSDGTNG